MYVTIRTFLNCIILIYLIKVLTIGKYEINILQGAECAKVPKMMKALQAGRPVSVPLVPNLADKLNASIAGENAYATLKGRLDRMVTQSKISIAIFFCELGYTLHCVYSQQHKHHLGSRYLLSGSTADLI